MPIIEQGYEPYRGPVNRGGWRFASIAWTALKRNRRWYTWGLLLVSLLFGSGKEFVLLLVCYLPRVIFGTTGGQGQAFLQTLENHPRFYSDMMETQTFWAFVMGVVVGAG